jgi:hypothetical protein
MTKLDAQALLAAVARWRRDYGKAVVHNGHSSQIVAGILAAERDLVAWFEPFGIELDVSRLPHRAGWEEEEADAPAGFTADC